MCETANNKVCDDGAGVSWDAIANETCCVFAHGASNLSADLGTKTEASGANPHLRNWYRAINPGGLGATPEA